MLECNPKSESMLTAIYKHRRTALHLNSTFKHCVLFLWQLSHTINKKINIYINWVGARHVPRRKLCWETHRALFVNWKVPRPWMSPASGRRRTSGASVKHGCALEEGKMLNCVGKSSRHGKIG